MRFYCPGCGSKYNVADEEVPNSGMNFPCKKCGFNITVQPPRSKAVFSPAKAESLPGYEEDFDEPTQVSSIPDQEAVPPVNDANSIDGGTGFFQDTLVSQSLSAEELKPSEAELEEDSEPPLPDLDEEEQMTAQKKIPVIEEQMTEQKKIPVIEEQMTAQKSIPVVEKQSLSEKAREILPEKVDEIVKEDKAEPAKIPLESFSGSLKTLFKKNQVSFTPDHNISFKHLFSAIKISTDLRKLLLMSAFVFLGLLLLMGLTYLGSLTKSSVSVYAALIIGGLLLWSMISFAGAVISFVTDREIGGDTRVSIVEGLKEVGDDIPRALGTPFVFIGSGLILTCVAAILNLIGLIPYAGPIIYGLSFTLAFLLCLAAIVVWCVYGLTAYSCYACTIRKQDNPMMAALRVFRLFKENLFWYLIHFIVVVAFSYLLLIILFWFWGQSMELLAWLGVEIMSDDFSAILMSIPGLGPIASLIPGLPLDILPAATDSGWQFDLAGWLVFLGHLAIFAVLVSFVLVYFFGAGVVNVHLLKKDE
jgi:predicted Zn finger-like uncharacterized protein